MRKRLIRLLLVVISAASANAPAIAQTGHVLDAVGPVNQSMGGAGTAMPLDAMGALYRNPACITGLGGSEIGFAFQAFAPETRLSSSVAAGAFGPAMPTESLSGSTTSDTDITPIPSFGFVCRSEDSRWVYGIGGFGVGGFGVDYPGAATNPITTPQPPSGFGFGPIYSEFQLLQITGTAAYQLTDSLSLGIGLNGDWATLAVSPFSAAVPDDENGDGFAVYPSGEGGDESWGVGFEAGLYYENLLTGVHLGASFKSPQWMQTYKFNSKNELGAGRPLAFDLDYPMIVSFGAGYSGFDRWRLAADVRYIDYANTDGFQPAGYGDSGNVTGFGWRSIWTASLGGEYKIMPRLALRAGYAFNQNPIRETDTFFNVPAPGIVQHHVSTGFSFHTQHDWTLSMALHHGLPNSIQGLWHSRTGPVPGTSVHSSLTTYSLTIGLAKRF